MSWWHWLGPIVAVVLIHQVSARYNARAFARDWQTLLTREGRRRLEALQLQSDVDGVAAETAVRGAARAHRRASLEEASRLLELGFEALEAATPDRLRRLRGMAVCARMASAIVPTPPLRPADFRLASVVTLAGLGQLVYHLLVGSGERFLLRLQLLRFAFPLVMRALSRSKWKTTASPAAAAALATFEAGVHDWRALDREHVESFRALLVSMSAEPAEEAAVLRH